MSVGSNLQEMENVVTKGCKWKFGFNAFFWCTS